MTTSKAECVREAARILSADRDRVDQMTPRAAAEAAHYAGGPSVDELEASIAERRARRRTRQKAA